MWNKYIGSFNILLVILFEPFFSVFRFNQLDLFILIIVSELDKVGAVSAQYVPRDLGAALFRHDPLILREKVTRGGAIFALENSWGV